MATTQARLDYYLDLEQKLVSGVARKYTEAGELIEVPSLKEVREAITSLTNQLAAENGSTFSLFQGVEL